METKHCKRCQSDKPEPDWYPSTWRKPGQWCKECYRQWNRDRYSAEYKAAVHRRQYVLKTGANDDPRDCEWCGSSYRPKVRIPSIYCSKACKGAARNARLAREREALKPVDRECLHCGSLLPQAMRADAVFCSAECNYKAHALQRKLRARTGQENKPGYLRAAICKRDGWRCGICHQRVNPSLQYPHPRAPSLDHVIPVSRGGLSEPANLRLVHLVCNLQRRNLGVPEQLALI